MGAHYYYAVMRAVASRRKLQSFSYEDVRPEDI